MLGCTGSAGWLSAGNLMLKLPWYGPARPHEDHPQIFMRSVLVLVGGVDTHLPEWRQRSVPIGLLCHCGTFGGDSWARFSKQKTVRLKRVWHQILSSGALPAK